MGVGNLYLGDPLINSPFYKLDKILWILSGSKKKRMKCAEKLVSLCTQKISYSI